MDDGSSEGGADQHGRGGRVTQLSGLNMRSLKKMATRRAHKRKLASDEESSCCSSDEEDDDEEETTTQAPTTKRAAVLSPASSSCHSSTAAALPPDPSPKPDDSDGGGGGGASVKDLEHAMSKHLPAATPPQQQPTDFSTDALLKQQQQRSTIQWIGAHHHHHHHLNHHHHQHHHHQQASAAAAGAPLPASALLRQLYANRESVIRANVSGGRGGGAGGGAGPSPYYAAPEQVGPLPTPPGSDGSSAYGAGAASGSDAFSNLVSSYAAAAVAAAASAGGGPGAYDYHSAMTPPSSVSPRDKHQQQLFDGYPDVLRQQYEQPAQPLPLKPQVYSAVHPLDAAYSSLEQPQFYHHTGAGAGFHLYHPANKTVTATATVYPEALKNSANWYSGTS